MSVTLTVFFDDPFWIGFLERVEDGKLSVAQVAFGAEPKDQQVYEWLLSDFYDLKFSPTVDGVKEVRLAVNPKRRQRQAAQLSGRPLCTKSQHAMQLAREENKRVRKVRSKEQHEMEEKRKLELHIAKKKAKHRGH